jgi:hypothetical protein
MRKPGLNSKQRGWLVPSLFIAYLMATSFGLFWLHRATRIIAVVNQSSGFLDSTANLLNWLALTTLGMLGLSIVYRSVKKTRPYLKWPLLIFSLAAIGMIVTIGFMHHSFGPFLQGGAFYPPLSMPPKSFDDPRDYYLLALFLANAILVIRLFVNGRPPFLSSPEDYSDILDTPG